MVTLAIRLATPAYSYSLSESRMQNLFVFTNVRCSHRVHSRCGVCAVLMNLHLEHVRKKKYNCEMFIDLRTRLSTLSLLNSPWQTKYGIFCSILQYSQAEALKLSDVQVIACVQTKYTGDVCTQASKVISSRIVQGGKWGGLWWIPLH